MSEPILKVEGVQAKYGDFVAVEEATLVRLRDSNHVRKWSASRTPLAPHRTKSRAVTRLSSARHRRSTTGSNRSTVQPRR